MNSIDHSGYGLPIEISYQKLCLTDVLKTRQNCIEKFYVPVMQREEEFIERCEAVKRVDEVVQYVFAQLDKRKNNENYVRARSQFEKLAGVSRKSIRKGRWFQSELRVYETIAFILRFWVDRFWVSDGVATRICEELSSRDVETALEFMKIDRKDFERRINQGLDFRCQEWAFANLNDIDAFKPIFKLQWPQEFYTDVFSFLANWGYELVKDPTNRLPGDLVIYCSTNQQDSSKEVKHVGIWTNQGNVVSKMGSMFAYAHPFDFVDCDYGDTIYFFRKIKSPIVRELLKSCLETLEVVKTFKHTFSCTYPVASLFVQGLLDDFRKAPIEGVLQDNIFNVKYNQDLRERICQRLECIFEENDLTFKHPGNNNVKHPQEACLEQVAESLETKKNISRVRLLETMIKIIRTTAEQMDREVKYF